MYVSQPASASSNDTCNPLFSMQGLSELSCVLAGQLLRHLSMMVDLWGR